MGGWGDGWMAGGWVGGWWWVMGRRAGAAIAATIKQIRSVSVQVAFLSSTHLPVWTGVLSPERGGGGGRCYCPNPDGPMQQRIRRGCGGVARCGQGVGVLGVQIACVTGPHTDAWACAALAPSSVFPPAGTAQLRGGDPWARPMVRADSVERSHRFPTSVGTASTKQKGRR